ncbi:class F sortase [Kineococcus sp. R8]|uniref:class F sortase n=1 Tax=Kineococcus siccus TaxID=2696567 RepID=UPI0014122776|nr:class F sortase [Kineococcus siccus]NAZ81077.1 class F sortase [Kineococcus siccus]
MSALHRAGGLLAAAVLLTGCAASGPAGSAARPSSAPSASTPSTSIPSTSTPSTPASTPSATDASPAPAAGAPAGAGGVAEGSVPVPASATRVADPAHVPVRLQVPAIGVDVPLAGLGIAPDGTLEVPTDFQQVGWFEGGPPPGDVGPAIIAGHVDSRSGPAPFYRLRDLAPGDEVLVTRADGTLVSLRVDGVAQYPKAAFPTAAVYGPVPGPALRLVTCGGSFDRTSGHYRDNVVVYAS